MTRAVVATYYISICPNLINFSGLRAITQTRNLGGPGCRGPKVRRRRGPTDRELDRVLKPSTGLSVCFYPLFSDCLAGVIDDVSTSSPIDSA